MKIYFKIVVPVLVGGMFLYTSCKKSENKPTAITTTITSNTDMTSDDFASAQVAVSLSKSLSGSMGAGINLNKSLNPASFAPSTKSVKYSAALCGFVADSILNYNTNQGDTILSHTTGHNKFYFDCTNGVPDGYTALDTSLTTGTAPGYSFIYNINQYYKIIVCGCGMLHVNGNQNANIQQTYTNNTTSNAQNTFVLSDLVINLNDNSDITSGTATFTSVGTNSYGTWNLSGTITYLGNHTAKIVVGTSSFTINILTGQLVP
jgi:hypothetical protein